MSYSPPTYGTEFAVVNIQEEAVDITVTYREGITPDMSGTQFTLQAGEVLQIQVQSYIELARII